MIRRTRAEARVRRTVCGLIRILAGDAGAWGKPDPFCGI